MKMPTVSKALIVDDEEDSIFLLREALREKGIGFLDPCIPDGIKAMEYLHRQGPYAYAERPDLVLLDINMPPKNGFQVLAEMKEDPDLRDIPVVILTASESTQDIRLSYAEGASSFITKPAHFEETERFSADFSRYWGETVRLPRG